MPKKPIQPQDKYVLRLPDGMRDRLKAAADDNGRSMNAEIVARLEASEGLRKLLDDFELAKQRIVSQQALEKVLQEEVTSMHRITTNAQDINRQLIELLMRRLDVGEEEITAITRPKGGE